MIRERQESNPGLLAEKQECHLRAFQPPLGKLVSFSNLTFLLRLIFGFQEASSKPWCLVSQQVLFVLLSTGPTETTSRLSAVTRGTIWLYPNLLSFEPMPSACKGLVLHTLAHQEGHRILRGSNPSDQMYPTGSLGCEWLHIGGTFRSLRLANITIPRLSNQHNEFWVPRGTKGTHFIFQFSK